jgi:hypothetical protein
MSLSQLFEHSETAVHAASSGAHIAPVTTSGGDHSEADAETRARAQSSELIVAKTATTSTYTAYCHLQLYCFLFCNKV